MIDDPSPINRAAYDHLAHRYAEAHAVMPPELLQAAETLLKHIGGLPARLLDLGCGAGRDLSWFESQGVQALGADLSQGMLAEARNRTHLPLCQMDMRRLGFATGSFSALWSSASLLHLAKKDVPIALAEMARVLVPGGHLILSVQKGSGEALERNPYDGTLKRFYARYQLDEMAALLAAAGFTVLHSSETSGVRDWLWFEARREPAV